MPPNDRRMAFFCECPLAGLSHNDLVIARTRDGRPFIKRGRKLQGAAASLAARFEAERDGRRGVCPGDPPVAVGLAFVYGTEDGSKWGTPRTPRPDVDNLVKTTMDCLVAAGWLHDDNVVTQLSASKTWGPCDLVSVYVGHVDERNESTGEPVLWHER